MINNATSGQNHAPFVQICCIATLLTVEVTQALRIWHVVKLEVQNHFHAGDRISQNK